MVDLDEISSLVVKITTLCCVLAFVAKESINIVQMDVKTTFLHGDIHEYLFMQ